MAQVLIGKGILNGQTLTEYTVENLRHVGASRDITALDRASFFKSELSAVIFVGVQFSNCSFARTKFRGISFRKCKFKNVDLTRTEFINCYISDCTFENCDPYYASFKETEAHPAQFKNCYTRPEYWNKALLLFADLRRNLSEMGNNRQARAAEYYVRVWERRQMYIRWRHKQLSSALPWLGSLFIWLLVGYGERPAYLGFWMFALISLSAKGYMKWFSAAALPHGGTYVDYWYYSFKIFCAKGFAEQASSIPFITFQVAEFVVGLILISLLIGSITRKLAS